MQLKELLGLGLIHPSVSPWGVPIIFHKKEGWVVESLYFLSSIEQGNDQEPILVSKNGIFV
jgi:hypothetical protein